MGNPACEFKLEPTQWQQEQNRLCVLADRSPEILKQDGETKVWNCERERIGEDRHCIFHTSDGMKERKNKEFANSLTRNSPNPHYIGSKFGDLNISNLDVSLQGESCVDLRYSSIDGDFDMVNTEINPAIELSGVKIQGDVSIFASNIDGDIIFKNSLINGNVFISGSTITGNVDFTGANLNGYIRVTNSHLPGTLNFSDTGLVNVAIESSEIGVILADTLADLTQRIPDSFLK